MEKIKEFIELEGERKLIQEKLQPLQYEMNKIVADISDLNDSLKFSSEREFISQKLWDALEEEKKTAALKLRERRNNALDNATYSSSFEPFDPFYDSWHLITFEKDGNRMRIQVSCNKNEGSISGMMTFLDTYWTTWFDVKELNNLTNIQ